MSLHNDRYKELVDEHWGGMNDAAMEQFFYANNPFALRHWTMNVVEALMIIGALWGLVHAWRAMKHRADPTGLCIWWASVVFLFVVEVPVYFPGLFGQESNEVFFIHNEFSLGLLFDMTPLYIMALYPALTYPCYLLVKRAGIFDQRGGVILGAVSAAFIFLPFYQIFDHYGPQFGWWLWDRQNPYLELGLASVPFGSIVGYSLCGPLALFLLTGFLIRPFVERRKSGARLWKKRDGLILTGLTLVTGFLTPLLLPWVYPPAYYLLITQTPDPAIMTGLYWGIIAAVIIIGLWQFLNQRTPKTSLRADDQTSDQASEQAAFKYSWTFFMVYLFVFAGLWLYAMPEYFSAEAGLTSRGTPTGSIIFVAICYLVCGFILFRSRPMAAPVAST